ncbi:DUF3108 domain-containing protein [Marinobacter sediminum]|uniref:DUF3108 domain-containing protein n=1 Tax=Marinobacter sediminum TaxID=256323 RepID=UPI00202F9A5C|nr:DUF3108 domain-containing protein [Marinobacter sediminum]MCM0612479.1 DUF3108 domain-containing protein [Marinobacter sediminum]
MQAIQHTAKTLARGVALLLCLGALAAPATTFAETETTLTPFEASYTASMEKGISLNGSAKRTLTPQDNDVWLYRTDVSSFIANIDESLELKWENNRVVPLRYRYRLSGFLVKNREQSIDFDWDAGVATGKYRGKPFRLELQEGALDPLGFQLQLRHDISAGKRDMSYQIIDRGSYDNDRFAVIDEEPLKTSRGTTTTVKAEKVRGEGAKRQTLMWFAPDEDFLLVRLLQVEPDGSKYELKLKQAARGD